MGSSVGRRSKELFHVLSAAAILLLTFFLVLQGTGKTTHASPGWTPQSSGVTTQLNDIAALTTGVAYAVGASGVIRATSDGGATWSAQSAGTANDLYGISFAPNSTVGWVVGAEGIIRKTTNGAFWSAQTAPSLYPLYDVYAVSSAIAYAVGYGGRILATANGGTNWNTLETPTGPSLRAISFAPGSSVGWAVGDGGTIHKTNDGGTWISQTSGVTWTLNDVVAVSNDVAYIVGGGGVILGTFDGGITWYFLPSATTYDLHGITFVSPTTGWAVGPNGTVLNTTDGGATWSAQTSGTTVDLLAVAFVGGSTGWVVGSGGTILNTTDAGATPTATSSPTTSPTPTFTPTATPLPPLDVTNMSCSPKLYNPSVGGSTTCNFALNHKAWAALLVLDVFNNVAYVSPVDMANPLGAGNHSIPWSGQLATLADGPYMPVLFAMDSDGHIDIAFDPQLYIKADNGQNPVVSNLAVTPASAPAGTDVAVAPRSIAFDVNKYHTPMAGVLNNSGAWVRLLTKPKAYAGHDSFVWDGKDAGGNAVPAGTYWFLGIATDDFNRGSGCYTSTAVSAVSCFNYTAGSQGRAPSVGNDVPQALREALPGLLQPKE